MNYYSVKMDDTCIAGLYMVIGGGGICLPSLVLEAELVSRLVRSETWQFVAMLVSPNSW